MNIKKLITGLTLLLLFGNGMANADWGDVYYCQMTNFGEITLEGEKKSWKLEKFKFKLNQTKKTMDFGSRGWFRNLSIEVETGDSPPTGLWLARNNVSTAYFDKGKGRFLHAQITPRGLISISADCDKF